MGKHYRLFTDRLEATVPVRSSQEKEIELETKLQQYFLMEVD